MVVRRQSSQPVVFPIHGVLCDRFEGAPERALNDLVGFANELIRDGLLRQERR